MRAVKSLRSIRLRSYVLPVLLGALALRFLIPVGYMPGSDEGTTLSVAMCSSEAQTELLEIPGEPAKPHCDYCTLPSMDAPLSPVNIAGLTPAVQPWLLPPLESQLSEAPLLRAQSPRAPPHS
jgi:hypothetical protein